MKTIFLSNSFVMQPAPAYIAGYRWNGPRKGEKPRPVRRTEEVPSSEHATLVTDALLSELEPSDAQRLEKSSADLGDPSTFDLGNDLNAQLYQGTAQATQANAVKALAQRVKKEGLDVESAALEAITCYLNVDGTWQQAMNRLAVVLGIGKAIPQINTTVPGFSGVEFRWRTGPISYSVKMTEAGPEYDHGFAVVLSNFEIDGKVMPTPVDQDAPEEPKEKPAVKPADDEGDSEEGGTKDEDPGDDDDTYDDDVDSELLDHDPDPDPDDAQPDPDDESGGDADEDDDYL